MDALTWNSTGVTTHYPGFPTHEYSQVDSMTNKQKVNFANYNPKGIQKCADFFCQAVEFKDYIFCFLGHSVGRYVFESFAPETNLRKMQCEQVRSLQEN